MIYISFSLSNPFSNRFANLYCKSWLVATNKAMEFEVIKDTTIIDFMVRVTTRQSHAGWDIGLGLLGYSVSLRFYDTRHWNVEQGRWMFYTEEEGYH